MNYGRKNPARALLIEVQRRLPAGQRFVQEAFTSEHRRPVLVRITDLLPDTFYLFDEITTRAFCDAVSELAAQHAGSRLTLCHPFANEIKAQQHHLERLAHKLENLRVFGMGQMTGLDTTIDFRSIAGSPLTRFRIALNQGQRPMLFICRELQRHSVSDHRRSQGFFSVDAYLIDEIADDVEMVARGLANRLAAFDKLQVLHQTTQRIARELESYSRRMDIAIRQAKRRPDLLTPARFERIVGQAIAKMEELKEIPRQAIRDMGKPGKRLRI